MDSTASPGQCRPGNSADSVEVCFPAALAASLFGMIMCGSHGASAAIRQ
ncbi:hypothetical protein I545_2472 [Mycobacterium kansasii 662]|uniref:Uncharacterized protein n=2 Tax=Mycobacterium kansasii TaxID=1768 RepID=A0A1V3XNP4_MYCKA|nr:hypothetical protein I547_4380 [Mycobacterium kansasii 824]EUA19986.1 hypothetical protein I545_2472 [Mycobacterium kansasii 662]OOK80854.1 hypothetical protein BZL29_1704 [Mycobacterium kansasii]